MPADRPNVLVIMTDEERYPPPYETESVADFRRTQLPARERLRQRSVELHRHYAASTACVPSRASLFTGHYPSLHGVNNTDGLAKSATDPGLHWLDPDTVPTLGDWFRAAGYETHYRGKWHISHPDLVVPGTNQSVRANDAAGNLFADIIGKYRRADRLDPFGFSGWIGREPHGADPADTGLTRDGIFADQIDEVFRGLESRTAPGPWLTVASFVNPHDIAFSGLAWNALGFPEPDDDVPEIAEAPSQSDSLAQRPRAQQAFLETWPRLLYPQAPDGAYRRLYYWLHKLVDAAIGRVLDLLEASSFADDTIVVFTSDHGDQLGAHGGLVQKWYQAYDESIRVPMLISGPGITPRPGGVTVPTSHVDLLPTLLGLADVDVAEVSHSVAEHHVETRPFVGRDLSGLVTGRTEQHAVDAPIYFMTEDEISRGERTASILTGDPFDPVPAPCRVESVITHLPTGPDGAAELWKLNHYYDTVPAPDDGGSDDIPVEEDWELHNLTLDPEERTDRATTDPESRSRLQSVLDDERRAKRLVPRLADRTS